MITTGDCVEVMAQMPEASVDAIVTDPPYGIGFMGKAWDAPGIARAAKHDAETRASLGPHSDSRPGRAQPRSSSAFGSAAHYAGPVRGGHEWQAWCQAWATEALRVAKPGAYLLAFGGTRTYHRLAVALEDAGWIIRDTLVWAYASGFPKSRALLKPAWEPIVMARKPGPLRELDIDGCRIGLNGGEFYEDRDGEPTAATRYGDKVRATPGRRIVQHQAFTKGNEVRQRQTTEPPEQPFGRWPANVILTDPIFDGGWDGVVGGGEAGGQHEQRKLSRTDTSLFGGVTNVGDAYGYADTGTYSRFFLIPKADRAEREPNYEGRTASGLEARKQQASIHADPNAKWAHKNPNHPRINGHPTVKPLELMRHLVRLVTPQGGVVLDPFLGSGTTAIAAEMEGFAWLGIEREAEYVAIAEARLNGTQRGLGLTA